MKVAVLGASTKQERYSYKAIQMLKDHGHEVFPVNPAYPEVLDLKCYPSLSELPEKIHTLSVYVSPDKIQPFIEDIIQLAPERVILNPGSESKDLVESLEKAAIGYLEACTLVLLSTNQF